MTTNFTDFREKLKSFLLKVSSNHEPLFITTKSGNFVLMSEEDYDSLDATDYLLKSPVNKKRLYDSLEQIKLGQTKPLDKDLLNKLLKEGA